MDRGLQAHAAQICSGAAQVSVRSEHRQILEPLRDRDPELAPALVRSHAMKFFRDAMASAEHAPAEAAVPTA